MRGLPRSLPVSSPFPCKFSASAGRVCSWAFFRMPAIFFSGAVYCSCVLFFSQCLPAQIAPPHRSMGAKRISVAARAVRSAFTKKATDASRLVAFAETAGPLRARTELEHQSPASFSMPLPDSYRLPVNLKLLAPGTASAASWESMNGVSAPVESAGVNTARTEFSLAEPAIHDEPLNHGDDLEYYAHHVPVVGPIMQHVLNQSKAHPRLTRVFEVIQPQLF